jgi:hypothetical protein
MGDSIIESSCNWLKVVTFISSFLKGERQRFLENFARPPFCEPAPPYSIIGNYERNYLLLNVPRHGAFIAPFPIDKNTTLM